jgi:hypothetical protein
VNPKILPAGRAVAGLVIEPTGPLVFLAPGTADGSLALHGAVFVGATAVQVGEASDALRRLALDLPEEESADDLIAELGRILQEAGATVTFDAERDITHPCFACGTAAVDGGDGLRIRGKHELVDLFFARPEGKPRVVTRPFCRACVAAGKTTTITEHDVDARTIRRIAVWAKELLDENDRYRARLREAAPVASVEQKPSGLYYLLSVRWTKRNEGVITWWGPDSKGYVYRLKDAGRYTGLEIAAHLDHFHNGHSTLAIPCAVVDALGVPAVTVTGPKIDRERLGADLVVEVCHYDRLRRKHVRWAGPNATVEQAP